MDKFFKHFGINIKKNSSDHVSSSSNIPQELNESTLALSKDKLCGWSAFMDFPLKYNSRRNSEIAHRLASHDMDCNRLLDAVINPDFGREQCHEPIYLNSESSRIPRTRASICFDSIAPKLLDVYSDPADLKVESTNREVEQKASTEDVFSEDEDYTVPYQPNSLQKCKTFGSEKDLNYPRQEGFCGVGGDHLKPASSSNLCLSKYKIRRSGDMTYDEPWDLNHTKRDLVGKLEATFSSNPALRPINSEFAESAQQKRSPAGSESPSEIQRGASRALRTHAGAGGGGYGGGRERCSSSKGSRENVPSRGAVHRGVNPPSPSMATCHCRHPSHRMTWQGVENVAIPSAVEREAMFPGKRRAHNSHVASPWHQVKNSIELLEEQSWYHGALGRIDAENLLRDEPPGSFLVRTSESNRRDFSLSLMSDGGLLHIKIVKENDQYILGQSSQPFESIPSIIKFFTVNKLPVRGTHHILLTNPVVQELL